MDMIIISQDLVLLEPTQFGLGQRDKENIAAKRWS